MNFDHLSQVDQSYAVLLINKIQFNIDLLEKLTGQKFKLAEVETPKPKAGKKEG